MKLPPAERLALALLEPCTLRELLARLPDLRPSQVKLLLGQLAVEGEAVQQGNRWALHPRVLDRYSSKAAHLEAARKRAAQPDQPTHVYDDTHPFHKGRIPPKY